MLIILSLFTLFVGFMLATLCGYHCRLAFKNETTNEVIKKLFSHFYSNPYDTGSKTTNFSARVLAPSDSYPLFQPLELFNPEPYVGPKNKAPVESKESVCSVANIHIVQMIQQELPWDITTRRNEDQTNIMVEHIEPADLEIDKKEEHTFFPLESPQEVEVGSLMPFVN